MEIGANTRLLAVIGDPVAHSLSPVMHNAAVHGLGLDAVYVALRASAAGLEPLLRALAAVGAAGNVTVPHKEATERLLTRKTDLCVRVGACNTFWAEQGELVGDNTDVLGVRAALAAVSGGGAPGGRWLVIGTGGAARAVAVAAAEQRAELYVRSRDADRGRRFATWAASLGVAAHAAADAVPTDVVINATPLGLRADDPLPIDPQTLTEARVALDLVYAPHETPWVRALRRAGLKAGDGRVMLVRQGAASFERFFPGQTAPIAVMQAAVERALRG